MNIFYSRNDYSRDNLANLGKKASDWSTQSHNFCCHWILSLLFLAPRIKGDSLDIQSS